MESFHVNDSGLQASSDSSSMNPAPAKWHPQFRYIASFSFVFFVIGTLCGYFGMKSSEAVIEEDDLAIDLNLGIGTLLAWFPEKNSELQSKKHDIIFHMMNFTDDSDPSVSKLVIDTIESTDAKDKHGALLDRRLQTSDGCKEVVLDFILAFSGWLKSFVKFVLVDGNALRRRITTWLDTNLVGPTAFQKFIGKIVEFAYKTSVKDKLKVLWGIIKDAWKSGGGWIKEMFKFIVDHAIDKAWPKTKTLVKLAAQIGTWVKRGHSEFIAQATLQYLATEAMIKNAKKLKACILATTTATTNPIPHEVAAANVVPVPLDTTPASPLSPSDPLKDHTLANLLFAFLALAVVIVLTPLSPCSEQPENRATRQGTHIEAFKRGKPFLQSIDSVRVFIVAYIITGNFIQCATTSIVALRYFEQINVVVGCLFILSGYVVAYITTQPSEPKCAIGHLDDRVKDAVERLICVFFPHLVVLAIFGVMFFWSDSRIHGPWVALLHGVISITLTQAWFPLSAEVWNVPTWFLSAFSFCILILPHAIKLLAPMTKPELRRTIAFLTLASVVPKLAYSYDLNTWDMFEGISKTHPNYVFYNCFRFNPLFGLCEVVMGAAACRLVMLDSATETSRETGSSLLPLVAMLVVLALRATSVIALNDMLIRGFVVIPLFISFLTRLHREDVASLCGARHVLMIFFNVPLLVFLSWISLEMLILHYPLGQLFYEVPQNGDRSVATKLWGGPLDEVGGKWFFVIYWLVVIVVSYVFNSCFTKSEAVKQTSKHMSEYIVSAIRR